MSFKTLQIDVINQKILLKNFLGKTDKSFSFYELKNFYNFNIGKTRTKLLINPIFKNSPEEFSDNLDKYQFEIEIINKRNNKREGFYFVTRSFYPAEFLKFIFENIERI